MATATKRKWEVGQTLWWLDHRHEIIKVGRKWLTVNDPTCEWRTYQVDAETLRVKCEYTYSVMHVDHNLYLAQEANRKAWHLFRRAIDGAYKCPETATAEGIHKAAAILGLTLEEKDRK